ncbi:MAG: hypothetical protein ACREL5_11060 [Gemmatimonadales bacterium]
MSTFLLSFLPLALTVSVLSGQASIAAPSSPLEGFWRVATVHCIPAGVPQCLALTMQETDRQLALQVRHDTVVVQRGRAQLHGPFTIVDADTVAVDGKHAQWIGARIGFSTMPDLGHTSRRLLAEAPDNGFRRRSAASPNDTLFIKKVEWKVAAAGTFLTQTTWWYATTGQRFVIVRKYQRFWT